MLQSILVNTASCSAFKKKKYVVALMNLVGLQKKNLSPDEYQYQRTQLLNRQQLELSDLDKKLADEERNIEKGALTDWEVRYARAKLDLKEKHYKVRRKKSRYVCETLTMPQAATKSKTLFLDSRSKSRSQGY